MLIRLLQKVCWPGWYISFYEKSLRCSISKWMVILYLYNNACPAINASRSLDLMRMRYKYEWDSRFICLRQV